MPMHVHILPHGNYAGPNPRQMYGMGLDRLIVLGASHARQRVWKPIQRKPLDDVKAPKFVDLHDRPAKPR